MRVNAYRLNTTGVAHALIYVDSTAQNTPMKTKPKGAEKLRSPEKRTEIRKIRTEPAVPAAKCARAVSIRTFRLSPN